MSQTEQELVPRSIEEGGLTTTTEFSSELAPTAAAAEKQFEIQSAIVLAKKYPRDEDAAFTKLMKACGRTSFAEEAEYSFPRGNQTVRGASVNLAREAARVWGNVRYGLTILRDDAGSRQIQGWAWDLETNTKISSEDDFQKLIFRKGKGWVPPDERDLRELTNRRGAILVRNCILQVVPKDLIEDARAKCNETLRATAAKDPDGARKKILLAFSELNVTPEMLAAYLGHPLAQSSPAEIADLRAVYKSIADGNTTWADYVAGNGEAAAADLKEKTRAKTDELKERLSKSESKPVDEAAEKKRLRKKIKDLYPEELIDKHTGRRDINALSLDELITLEDGLAEYKE